MERYEFRDGEEIQELARGLWKTTWEEEGNNTYDCFSDIWEGLSDAAKQELREKYPTQDWPEN